MNVDQLVRVFGQVCGDYLDGKIYQDQFQMHPAVLHPEIQPPLLVTRLPRRVQHRHQGHLLLIFHSQNLYEIYSALDKPEIEPEVFIEFNFTKPEILPITTLQFNIHSANM